MNVRAAGKAVVGMAVPALDLSARISAQRIVVTILPGPGRAPAGCLRGTKAMTGFLGDTCPGSLFPTPGGAFGYGAGGAAAGETAI
jgi:hypothetical protein